MSSVHNSVETVNAAASAIVTAESRVQPSSIQKRRWGSCWSLYWCFGSYKQSKRIGHAVLVSEPTSQGSTAPIVENRNSSTTIILPFIAPPSSPASFLPSDPPSATHSPAGLLSLASLSVQAYSPGPIFAVGPYAHETQLVSPPVFSTFTTEPSTASFTPPPEPVQMTTPSSPEVPFAQLLSSSLARNRRNSTGTNMRFSLSQYEFQPYPYPGSPSGNTKSPGSAMSTSGTSSPFPDKRPPKFEHYFSNYKWGSRVGSGSLTPNGWGSRLGSGAQTPSGGISRLGSGAQTPTNGGGEPVSRDGNLFENQQISEVASLSNSDNESVVVDHRVSFELVGEDIPTCIVKESVFSSNFALGNVPIKNEVPEMVNEIRETGLGEESKEGSPKHRTISLGSSKDFNFNNAKDEISDKSTIDCEWWTNDKELGPPKDWTFFPMLKSGIS